MQEQQILQIGTFGSGYIRREVDASVTYPVPNTPAAVRYWVHLYQEDQEEAIRRLGELEKLNVSWATTFAYKLMDKFGL